MPNWNIQVPHLDVVTEFDRQVGFAAEDAAPKWGIDKRTLISFVKNHERRHIVLTNLSREIAKFEHKYGWRYAGKPEVLRQKRSEICFATANLFVEMAKHHKDLQNGKKPDNVHAIQDRVMEEKQRELEEEGILEADDRQDLSL